MLSNPIPSSRTPQMLWSATTPALDSCSAVMTCSICGKIRTKSCNTGPRQLRYDLSLWLLPARERTGESQISARVGAGLFANLRRARYPNNLDMSASLICAKSDGDLSLLALNTRQATWSFAVHGWWSLFDNTGIATKRVVRCHPASLWEGVVLLVHEESNSFLEQMPGVSAVRPSN